MGTLIGSIIGFIILSIILRLLRRLFRAVDYIILFLVFGIPIYVWTTEGFWWGVLTFCVTAIVAYIMTGIGSKTEIRRYGYKWSFECSKCGYGNLEILSDETTDIGSVITTKCPRCGQIQVWSLTRK